MPSDIETRIRERAYQSPSRARAGIHRSKLQTRVKNRLLGLVDDWEGEGSTEAPVIAGLLPEGEPSARAHPAELVGGPNGVHAGAEVAGAEFVRPNFDAVTVNLNAIIRARLTPRGVALLYEARSKVRIPDDLLSSGGVWVCQLWEFMLVMGDKLEGPEGDVPVDRFRIDILDPRV